MQNAIDLARSLGVDRPKVAVLCATESVNPSMPATLDAAALSKMADRMQIRGALVDGPLALDNAISREAAELSPADQPRGFGAGAGGQLRDRGPARARLGASAGYSSQASFCGASNIARSKFTGSRCSRSSRLRARIPGRRGLVGLATALGPVQVLAGVMQDLEALPLFVDDAQIVVQIQQAPEVVVQQPGQRDADVFLRLHVAGDAGMLLEAGVDGVGGRRRGGRRAASRRWTRAVCRNGARTFLQRPDREIVLAGTVARLQASRAGIAATRTSSCRDRRPSSNIAGQRIEASNHACPRATAHGTRVKQPVVAKRSVLAREAVQGRQPVGQAQGKGNDVISGHWVSATQRRQVSSSCPDSSSGRSICVISCQNRASGMRAGRVVMGRDMNGDAG